MWIITTGDQFLLLDMNHSRLQCCHRETRCRVNSVQIELSCKQNDTELFYRLHPTSRENFSTDLLDSNYSAIEESVWVETYRSKLRLHFPSFLSLEEQSDSSLQDWIAKEIDWKALIDSVREAIISGDSIFVVDSSFYSDCSHLVSAH